MQVPEAQAAVAIIGCVTALLAALIALTQTDLKRVMAYSTVSQLGYMFMGLGAGVGKLARFAVIAGMFHLFTHAFFKALLFLASGSVMHSMGGVIDMRRFGGLRHRMPITCWTFAVGALALCGIFPLGRVLLEGRGHLVAPARVARLGGARRDVSDALHGRLLDRDRHGGSDGLLHRPGLLPHLLRPREAAEPDDPEADPDEAARRRHGHDHDAHVGHESPPVMWIPLAVLAVCAVLVGHGLRA